MLSEQRLSGRSYLAAVTHLLQTARSMHPTKGVWEAADLQWWWRKARATDTWSHPFWFDETGNPVAAAIATDWGGRIGLDIIVVPGAADEVTEFAWQKGLAIVSDAEPPSIEVMVDDDDSLMQSLLTDAGFAALPDKGASAWMTVADRTREPATMPGGYSLASRVDMADTPHHFIDRNGPDVAQRLGETSLYRPELDLAAVDPTGEIAAYGLFWFDPATRIGFVEPMGTNEAHRRKGLARHILHSGIGRLRDAGATRIKINYEQDNEASSKLYLDVGFTPTMTTSLWLKHPPPPQTQGSRPD